MKTSLLFCVFFCCFKFIYAQEGEPDPSFGNKGIVTTDMDSAFNYPNLGEQVLVQAGGSLFMLIETNGLSVIIKKRPDGSRDLLYGSQGNSVAVSIYQAHAALQTDGKIVIAGYTLNTNHHNNGADFAIVRIGIDGTLDHTFNGGNIKVIDLGGGYDIPYSLVIQPDGKILVGGDTFSLDFIDYVAIVRLNTDGTFDDDFGSGGMMPLDNPGGVFGLAIQSDGKILACGSSLKRFNTDGSPDSSFNGNGQQAIIGTATQVAVQPGGKIICSGFYNPTIANQVFSISRFNINGSIDSTFNGNGFLTSDFSGDDDGATSLAIQGDGKIIAGGYSRTGNNKNFVVARYNLNGSPDLGFSGDGMEIANLENPNDYLNSIALQSDGKLVVLGNALNAPNTIAAVRYNADGSLDKSFDSDGRLSDHISQGYTVFTSTVIQNDGKAIVAGYTWNGLNFDFALARFNVTGVPDNTFSADGKQTTDFGATDDKAKAIVIQSDGKILVAGIAENKLAIARYNSNGALDLSFSKGGLQTMIFGSGDSATSLAIQTDGKIVIGGSAIVRLNPNGSVDSSFNQNGRIETHCDAIAIQRDGKIVAGDSNNIYRYQINGNPDSSFGENGLRMLDIIYEFDAHPPVVRSIAIQNDDKIVLGGSFSDDWRVTMSSFSISRLSADGSNDIFFNNGNPIFTYVDYYTFGTSLVVQPDNKIIIGGFSYNGSSDDFTLARYNADGTPDNNFSQDGIQTTPASGAYDRVTCLAISPADSKLYAAGFGQYPGNFGVLAKYLLGPGGGPTAGTFTTAANGDWNSPGTWIGGVIPSATSPVVIKHKVTITVSTTCYSLIVQTAAGNLIIASGKNLLITH